jgi:hypothetical protein
MIRVIPGIGSRRPTGSTPHAVFAMLLVAAVAIAAPSAGAAPPVPPQAPERIVAGESIGLARLGMADTALAAILGPSAAQSPTRRVYPRYGLVIDYHRSVAVRIATTAARYRTFAGAGVGTVARETARLVGDVNAVTTVGKQDTTIWYEFLGIGFVVHGGRAVEAFVTEPIALGPKPAVPGAPANPAAPPASARSTAPQAGALLRDLKIQAFASGALQVTGTIVNTASAPEGPVVVSAVFTRVSGAQVEAKITMPSALGPGQGGPFTLQVEGLTDLITRYQVSAANPGGTVLANSDPEAVAPSTYADYARRHIKVKVDVGAPTSGIGTPSVQAIVSVADTGPIPPAWVQAVSVEIPYFNANGSPGAQNAQVRPGQQQTVVIPAGARLGVPVVTGVMLGGG